MEKKKKRYRIISIICVIILVGSVGYIGWYFWSQYVQKQNYEKMKEEVIIEETAEKPQETQEPEQPEEPEQETVEEVKEDIPIDFESLKAQNPDIYAWIQIDGTQIAYPVLQSADDDSYYLDHNLDGSTGYPGCIYTEQINLKDFSNFNTILYGHNMKDGSMFGELKQYQDETFMKEHQEIVVYTEEHKYTYKIFAAVVYSDAHIIYQNGYFLSDEQRQNYIDSILNAEDIRNAFDRDIEVTKDDKILTLSTCVASQSNKRFLVEAVLINE